MPIWSQYLQNVADVFNTTVTQAGVISSLLVSVGLLVVVLIATRGKGALVVIPATEFFSILFFVYIGWFPVWTGSVIALILVLFVGLVLSRGTTGGS